MSKKALLAAALVIAGTLVAGTSAANAPPLGSEQFEEYYNTSGQLVGYVHWSCDGRRTTWGTLSGELEVTRRRCQ
ncbi:hypothetical protein K4L06_17575 [Lysobacter sp. BMK333-48F3]|uniref:DUF6289 family protein n=1 Tax=Lysobacter sp. BMK333-48F3 TaxID=2867962 RepID=UPI001C8B6C61|nr:DUF6289 family protein [Lysobacter sp. BMK333-48F3]MBX9403122.1 hypothetical protein [Lysobacter sp. BMK333-48F3]